MFNRLKYLKHSLSLNIQTAQILLTLSRHLSLSPVSLGGCSRLHLVLALSWYMSDIAGRPKLLSVIGCRNSLENVTYNFVLTSPAALSDVLFDFLGHFFFKKMRSKFLCSKYFVGCCIQDSFITVRSIQM